MAMDSDGMDVLRAMLLARVICGYFFLLSVLLHLGDAITEERDRIESGLGETWMNISTIAIIETETVPYLGTNIIRIQPHRS